MFEPTQSAACERLAAFVPRAGADYARRRNYDRPGHPDVSGLSPYLRHRIITEEDVIRATLGQHTQQAAEKFLQEVFWRTYWKGWLEMRPSVWTQYTAAVKSALNQIQTQSGLRTEWEAACKGDTGMDCFDHWAQELVTTGYLHNHARMWFASIWIFTLRLPWELGADFFLRHLLDGDPASNTLSWRWVAGLQTIGKTYLARRDNIAKYTNGRFDPQGLAPFATPLTGWPAPDPQPIAPSDAIDPAARTGLLLTEEDLSPDWLLDQMTPLATATFDNTAGRSPLHVSPLVQSFTKSAMADAVQNHADQLGAVTDTADLVAWAQAENITQIVTSYAPTGPSADALQKQAPALADAGVTLVQKTRPYDARAWPHATKGFFKFRTKIPALIDRLDAGPGLFD